jgi:hypothetical protein
MLRATRLDVDLEVKELPPVTELERRYPGLGTRVLAERLVRARQVHRGLGDSRTTTVPLSLWRLGDAIVVAQPNEAYSWLQTELRRCFADRAVIVMNLTGGYGRGYLPRASLYDHEDLYQVWQTPYARGSLERVADAAKQGIVEHLLAPAEGASGKA